MPDAFRPNWNPPPQTGARFSPEEMRQIKVVAFPGVGEIMGKATSKISETKAPRLFALYRTAKHPSRPYALKVSAWNAEPAAK